MGAPVLEGAFTMPMFRDFVPPKIRPWIYLLIAVTFQFSGGLYMGTVNQMAGETTLMREDLMMCLYANLAGMAIWFPMLFRMKFRFTNRMLLLSAAAGVLLCNLAAPHITCLPLLWAVCFVEGICKIQGTFECMSTIQLWMTPERDFTVFFPFLHIVILGSMQLSDLASTWLMYHFHWSFMHYLVAGLMIIDLLVIFFCTTWARVAPKLPLLGIDWLGGIMWAALLLQVAFFFNYGQFYDWWNSPVMRRLAVSGVLTLLLCIGRMISVRHPFYEPQMWRYRHLVPVLVLVALVEGLLAAEHVLEETFLGEVMHYPEVVSVRLDWFMLAGAVAGCLFSWWWMHMRRFNYLRLIIAGISGIIFYLLWYYFMISSDIRISFLYVPTAVRGFAYAVLSATFMVCLEEIMSFRHFFQALSVFNMLHMVVGGVVGAAVYSRGLSVLMSDNISRYGSAVDMVALSAESPVPGFMEEFMRGMMEISIKQIYGWAAYAAVLLFLLFLLYDMPVRRRLKLMPLWRAVRNEAAGYLRRISFRQ